MSDFWFPLQRRLRRAVPVNALRSLVAADEPQRRVARQQLRISIPRRHDSSFDSSTSSASDASSGGGTAGWLGAASPHLPGGLPLWRLVPHAPCHDRTEPAENVCCPHGAG